MLTNSPKKKYETLFTDLTDEDMASVCKYLNEVQADYSIEGASTIMVPADQETKLKAGHRRGYLDSGADYSLYLTNISSLSTESDRAQLNLYQLQDRLEATIRNFDGVHDATVNIAMGEDRRYVLSQDNTIEASASVIVTMTDDAAISDELAEAICATVSHAVKGLDIVQVDIRDSQGNTYDGTDGENFIDRVVKKQVLEKNPMC